MNILKSVFQPKTHKELEPLVIKTLNSKANNYKDMAQDYFKEFCTLFETLSEQGKLNEKQIVYYKAVRDQLTGELREFTHKDQKPYWH